MEGRSDEGDAVSCDPILTPRAGSPVPDGHSEPSGLLQRTGCKHVQQDHLGTDRHDRRQGDAVYCQDALAGATVGPFRLSLVGENGSVLGTKEFERLDEVKGRCVRGTVPVRTR